MNRRRALVLYEMRLMRWILMAGIFCILVFLVIFNGYLKECVTVFVYAEGAGSFGTYGSYFSSIFLETLHNNHAVILLLLAVMVMIQFQDLHRKKREEYMSSLPFVKRERFLIKSLTGLAVLFADWLVMAAGILIVRQNVIVQFQKRNLLLPHYAELLANETVWHTLRTLGIFGLEILAAYTIFVMLHSMVNKSAVASIFALGVMLAPVIFAHAAGQWYIWITGVTMPNEMGGLEYLTKIFMGDSLAVFSMGTWEYFDINQCYYILYWPAWQAVLVLLVVILICSAVIWRMSRGRDAVNDNILVAHRGARIFLAVGMGLCLGAALATVFAMRFDGDLSEYNVFYSYILLEMISSPILALASWKILKISIR